MKIFTIPLLCCAVLTIFSACQPKIQRTIPGEVYQFDLKQIAKTNTLNSEWVKSPVFGGQALSVTVDEANSELVLTPNSEAIDWETAKYLVCEVWHENPYCVMMRVQFYRKTGDESAVARQGEEAVTQDAGPRMSCVIGIMPSLKTKMIFPLSYLDGQQVFIPRQPRQLKGTIGGRRIDPDDVGKVSIQIGRAHV